MEQMLLITLSAHLLLQAPAGDPGYATDALRELVRAAAEMNVRVPEGLASYTATVETETALVGVDQRSREQTVLLEQIAQSVAWDRTGKLDQRVIGYRAQSSVLTTATALSLPTWIVPVLYGNRFGLLFGPPPPSSRKRKPTDKPPRRVESIHPFSPRRDEIYRFSGGDTIAVVRPGARTIPVVRIRVEPVMVPAVATNVLRGELMVDAASHQLISLRGEILEVGGRGSVGQRLRNGLFNFVGYVDFQGREIDGRYWIPGIQRIELQISSPLAGDGRGVWRFQTRFDDIAVATNDSAGATGSVADTLAAIPRKLTLASEAELASYPGWRLELGEGTADLRVDDFSDIEQLRLDARGPEPTLEFYARRFDDLFRFNKVEGAFTGVGVRARAANRRDGYAIGGTIGRAWSEEATRGGGFAEWNAPRWRLSATGERSLETVSGFAGSPRRGDWVAAVLGSDDFDYLDRRAFDLKLERDLSFARGRLVADAGFASDRNARASISRGLFNSDSGFRPNRPIDPGSYGVISVSTTLNPDVTGESIRPGWMAGARIEYATGDLDWARAEARAGWRQAHGRLITTGRIDAGLVESDRVPLQQLFAIGGESDVLGFEYKEFGGDRAAIGRASVRYALPIFERPFHPPFMRSSPRTRLPGLAPALAVGVRSVWTDASSSATLDALSRFGMRGSTGPLATRPTAGAPAAASVGVLLFSGSLFVGWSRRLDSHRPWTFTFARGTAM